jgi:hypothetical protein
MTGGGVGIPWARLGGTFGPPGAGILAGWTIGGLVPGWLLGTGGVEAGWAKALKASNAVAIKAIRINFISILVLRCFAGGRLPKPAAVLSRTGGYR